MSKNRICSDSHTSLYPQTASFQVAIPGLPAVRMINDDNVTTGASRDVGCVWVCCDDIRHSITSGINDAFSGRSHNNAGFHRQVVVQGNICAAMPVV